MRVTVCVQERRATAVTETTNSALIINMCPPDLARHLRTRRCGRQHSRQSPEQGQHPQNAHHDPMDISACHGNQEFEDDEEGDLNRFDKGKNSANGKEQSSGKGSKG